MDKSLLVFLITLGIVIIVCTIIAVKREKKSTKCILQISDNNIMDSNKYTGKYSVCNKINEADKEF